MESACCFIGHRNIERASEVQEKLRKELRKLIEQGTTRFIFGDHSEFNTLCYDTVTELMQEYPQIKRVKFRKDYPEITESVKQYFFNGYEDNICPKGVAQSGRASYVERNQAMIMASDICIFYSTRTINQNAEKSRNIPQELISPKAAHELLMNLQLVRKKKQ